MSDNTTEALLSVIKERNESYKRNEEMMQVLRVLAANNAKAVANNAKAIKVLNKLVNKLGLVK